MRRRRRLLRARTRPPIVRCQTGRNPYDGRAVAHRRPRVGVTGACATDSRTMRIQKAIITAAGRSQRALPLQSLVDRDGVQKSALQIVLEVVKARMPNVRKVPDPPRLVTEIPPTVLLFDVQALDEKL